MIIAMIYLLFMCFCLLISLCLSFPGSVLLLLFFFLSKFSIGLATK